MENYIIIGIIALILGAAIWYIIRAIVLPRKLAVLAAPAIKSKRNSA